MPSSSTHSTTQETLLHASWRTAYLRLRSTGGDTQAAILSREFAEVLDVSFKDLTSCYWPPGPAGRGAEVAGEEWNMHQAISKFGWKLNDAQKVEQAANAVVEAGEVLVKCGREVEGEMMGEMAKELHELAVKVARLDGCDGSDSESWEDSDMKDA